MSEILSMISLMVLLVAQSAVVMSDSSSTIASVLSIHLVVITISIAYWMRTNRTCLPPYSIATAVEDHPEGGKVISTERDSVLAGSAVAGLFFGWPAVSRLVESADSGQHRELVLLLVAITPASVYVNWYFLRRILWVLFPLLVGWSGWRWLNL